MDEDDFGLFKLRLRYYAANQEVGMLRADLASTSKRLSQISFRDSMAKTDIGTQVEDSKSAELEASVQRLSGANQQLLEDYKKLLEDHDALKISFTELKTEHEKTVVESSNLKTDCAKLVKENEDIRQIKADNGEGGKGKPSYGELKLQLIQSRQELNRAKEVLQDLKSDRKRLKGEKLDLLSQMKQLYATLEEKETELREFIRNYEQRVKESDDMIKQLAREKEETDHEKWDIITKAREATEKAMFFKTQLDSRDQQVKALEADLAEAKRMLGNLGQTFPSPTLGLSSSMGSSSNSNDNNNFILSNSDSYSISSTGEDCCLLNYEGVPSDSSTAVVSSMKGLASSTPVTSHSEDAETPPILQRLSSQTSTISEIESDDLSRSSNSRRSGGKNDDIKKKKKNLSSGFSRIFNRSRLRRSVALTKDETIESLGLSPSCAKLSVLNEDNYQEKLSTVEHMVGLKMEEWRAHQVLAWLEITLAMPMYAIACLHNIKSGKVLLGLSDSELSAALGVSNHIHRRKLRLSIEQHRNPEDVKYPKANEMDPTWIAHRFLPELGLPQYTSIFEEQLCDGHIINTLTRRDLEKYFSVHRKFHQSSIMHAVELLRRIDFNKEKLYKRRTHCEDSDTDLIVWTNERIVKWIKSIDLGEYSDSLKESGVHGALIVLEPSFCSDTLSSCLGIPPSKSYIRRHLDTELDSILKPARAALDTPEIKTEHVEEESQLRKKGIQRGMSQDETKNRLSFRGSIGRAFGKKSKNDVSSRKTISGPIPIQHSSLSSLDTSSELLKKGFCLPGQCSKPGGNETQGSESDLQKSFSALMALQQKQRACSEEKIPSRKGDDKPCRLTVVDLVKDLKKDASSQKRPASTSEVKIPKVVVDSGESDASSKAKRESNTLTLLSLSEGESSLASYSSQDTLTDQSVVTVNQNTEDSDIKIESLPEKTTSHETPVLEVSAAGDKSQRDNCDSSLTSQNSQPVEMSKQLQCKEKQTFQSRRSVSEPLCSKTQENESVQQGSTVKSVSRDSVKRSSMKTVFPHSTPV